MKSCASRRADSGYWAGAEGDDRGGRIVAEGTPEDVARVKESYTGAYLKGLLGRRGGGAHKASGGNGRGKQEAGSS